MVKLALQMEIHVLSEYCQGIQKNQVISNSIPLASKKKRINCVPTAKTIHICSMKSKMWMVVIRLGSHICINQSKSVISMNILLRFDSHSFTREKDITLSLLPVTQNVLDATDVSLRVIFDYTQIDS